MKNLEELYVKELDQSDLENINGGEFLTAFLVGLAIGALFGYLIFDGSDADD